MYIPVPLVTWLWNNRYYNYSIHEAMLSSHYSASLYRKLTTLVMKEAHLLIFLNKKCCWLAV